MYYRYRRVYLREVYLVAATVSHASAIVIPHTARLVHPEEAAVHPNPTLSSPTGTRPLATSRSQHGSKTHLGLEIFWALGRGHPGSRSN